MLYRKCFTRQTVQQHVVQEIIVQEMSLCSGDRFPVRKNSTSRFADTQYVKRKVAPALARVPSGRPYGPQDVGGTTSDTYALLLWIRYVCIYNKLISML